MTSFLLCHRHEPRECRFAFAAWQGFASPLRHGDAVASCASGGHRLWWRVEAADSDAALTQLPPFVADRTEVVEVEEVRIP
jgi:hypothetical protein